jgi:hypothetical protein
MKSARMAFVFVVVVLALALTGCSGNTAPKAATPAPGPKAPAAAITQPGAGAQPTQAAIAPTPAIAATGRPGAVAPTQAPAASVPPTTTVASTAQAPGAATAAPAAPAPAAGATVTATTAARPPVSVTGTVAAAAAAPAPSATAAAGARTFNNPFVYCAAAGTIDQPDARYTGQAVPDSVVEGLMKALSATAEPTDTFRAGTVWRCMNYRVYACNFGANLPCSDKANASRTPTPAMATFCQDNANADNIPMAVTGHNVVFDWSCKNGTAVAGRQLVQVDPRGFVQDIWYPINPPVAAEPQPTQAAATAVPAPAGAGGTYSDPFAFCAAVDTIDAPDARYTGELLPDSFVKQAMKAFGAPANVAVNDYKAGVFWRCADKRVLACFVGANLPCTEQANTDKTPTQAMTDFCKQNPSTDNIPMVVTGRSTVYNWSCKNGTAVAGERFAEVDDQGFVKNIWHPVSPQ